MLVQYSSDGTPMQTRHFHKADTSSGLMVRRSGRRGDEFLMQRAWLKYNGHDGRMFVRVMLDEPRRNTAGKIVWAQVSFKLEFLPSMVSLGVRSLVINACCFDRAVYEPLSRILKKIDSLESNELVGTVSLAFFAMVSFSCRYPSRFY